jgi:aryl-alcohol dehydrogenase-like predicted oxidoreductase
MKRRKFLQHTALAAAAFAVDDALAQNAPAPTGALPRRRFGNTDVQISALGLGGFHLGQMKDEAEAIRVVHEALDAGINFIDNAWEYNKHRSEERVGKALVGKRDGVFVMTKVCTHGRGKDVAMHMLEESLRRLKTDHLDLWQIHEVVYENDPELCFAKGGVIEALEQAKRQGKVRYVGFTGHKDPAIHLNMLSKGFAFDSVQMPLNVFDGAFRSFEQQVLPEVNRRNIAALGMKSLGGTGDMVARGAVTVTEALRYAMSLPVVTTISGIDSLSVLRQNLAIARGFKPLTADERAALRQRTASYAAVGRFELYKTTMHFDAEEGRTQHGFPSPDELPL